MKEEYHLIGFFVILFLVFIWYLKSKKSSSESYTPKKTPGYESFTPLRTPGYEGFTPKKTPGYESFTYPNLGGNALVYPMDNKIIGYIYNSRLGPQGYNTAFNAPCESSDCVTVYEKEPFLRWNNEFQYTC